MSHVLELPDEVYKRIEAYAASRGLTPEEAVRVWADRLEQAEGGGEEWVYNPADDPLAEFLGTGELVEPDAIRRHDEVIAEEALDAHAE